MIVTSCPTRISFSSCDHRPFDENWGGVAINACINKRVYVLIRKRNDLEKHKYRISYSKTELCNLIDEIEHPLIRECIRFSKISDPLEIIYISDVPATSGLGTSSSLVVSLLKGLLYYKNASISPELLFDHAYVLERESLKLSGGWQDYVGAFGGINFLSGYSRNVKRTPVLLSPEKLSEFEKHLLLIYTGNQADSKEVLEEQLSLLRKSKTLEETLKIKGITEEIHSIMSMPDFSVMDIAYPMRESWELKKTLSSSMTSPQIDIIERHVFEVCPSAGFRLVGSGGGRGLILVVCPPELHADIVDQLLLPTANVKFDMEGAKVNMLWE